MDCSAQRSVCCEIYFEKQLKWWKDFILFSIGILKNIFSMQIKIEDVFLDTLKNFI